MSSFPGPLPEIPGVCIDRFDCAETRCAFFLSHAHWDHMKGLDDPNFADHLRRTPKAKLYMSDVTRALIVNWANKKFEHLADYIRVLDFESAVVVPVGAGASDDRVVSVNILPSGHCPGSVMFLFRCAVTGKRVLYTGDLRLEVDQLRGMRALHSDEDGSVLPVDVMHLDTTFCTKTTRFLPTRTESAEALVEVVRDWLSGGPKRVVLLDLAANFGHEFLLLSLSERLQTTSKFAPLVHVKKERYKQYQHIPEILPHVTTDPSSTRIHSGCGCALYRSGFDVKKIKPSAMVFTMSPHEEKEIVQEAAGITKLCYSIHASCEELADMIAYMKPKEVHPNVIPKGSTKNEVKRLLKEIHARVARETKSSSSDLGLRNANWSLNFDFLRTASDRVKDESPPVNFGKDFDLSLWDEEKSSPPKSERRFKREDDFQLRTLKSEHEAKNVTKSPSKPVSASQEEKCVFGERNQTSYSAPSNIDAELVNNGATAGNENEFKLVESLDSETKVKSPAVKRRKSSTPPLIVEEKLETPSSSLSSSSSRWKGPYERQVDFFFSSVTIRYPASAATAPRSEAKVECESVCDDVEVIAASVGKKVEPVCVDLVSDDDD